MSLPSGYADPTTADALPLHVVTRDSLASWRGAQPANVGAWLDAQGFDGSPFSAITLPDSDGGLAGAVIGVGDMLDPFAYGHAPHALPARAFAVAGDLPADARNALQLGWGLGAYRFSRYRKLLRAPAQLAVAQGDADAFAQLAACVRVRDLVNTPTEHMGPDQLEQVACEIAERFGAQIDVVSGDDLITQNFPAIHAVGRASHRAPRLITLRWGDESHPHVVIVGKGVCFDTGGLDLKPADGMRNMKKDMGGAAHAIALAELVMTRKLPLRITLLVPAVENAVGPNAFRPGEVLDTRKGVTVEIDNTDAEGRVILCDALAYAVESKPELIIDLATLTGAARIALGAQLPALFTRHMDTARDLVDLGLKMDDPLWHLPLWAPYKEGITSSIADIVNTGRNALGGAINAALFLEAFVPAEQDWLHIDLFAWNDIARPGRPVGGEAQTIRTLLAYIEERFSA